MPLVFWILKFYCESIFDNKWFELLLLVHAIDHIDQWKCLVLICVSVHVHACAYLNPKPIRYQIFHILIMIILWKFEYQMSGFHLWCNIGGIINIWINIWNIWYLVDGFHLWCNIGGIINIWYLMGGFHLWCNIGGIINIGA